jgi:membrane-bound lytic murein transglycosylase D
MKNFAMVVSAAMLVAGCAQQSTIDSEKRPSARSLPLERIPVEISQRQNERHTHPEHAPDPDNLWNAVTGGLTFATEVPDDKVASYLEWYTGNQRYFDRTLARARNYLPYVVDRIEENGLPMELALLPFVESAYNPFAYSHSHAAGLWQFIPGTAREYGLRRNWWYEGRRDIVDSTGAAIRYLSLLNNRFDGDWLLALAAYNSGPGNVGRAIERNRRRGKATDFWSLSLPRETRAYVPRLIALSKVMSNPAEYDIELPDLSRQPAFAIVELPEPIDLMQAARIADVSAKDIYHLNPGYNRWVTPPSGPHRLLLPAGKETGFLDSLASLPKEQWRPLQEYVVRRGDTLSEIADDHNVRVADLRRLNRLSSNFIKAGQALKIPGTGVAESTPFQPIAPVQYRVRRGDSLWSIARAFDTSVSRLRRANGLSGSSVIRPGQVLRIGTERSSGPRQEVNYQVKKGDSLYEIARRFRVDISDILAWNNMEDLKQYIHPGQRLTLYPGR